MIEQYITVGGARLWTAAEGTNRQGTILLCNGGPGCCDYLAVVSAMLEDDWRVIRFEQRGCGRSAHDGCYDLQTVLADMEAIRAAYGLKRWVVCGHSWGGDLALIYAMAHPERTAAAISLAGMALQRNKEWNAAYHNNRTQRGEEQPPMAYPGNPEVNQQGNADFCAYIQRPGLLRDLARLQTSVLLCASEEDIRPCWPTEQLHNLLPRSTYALIPGAAHYMWLQAPKAVRAQLREFLAQL